MTAGVNSQKKKNHETANYHRTQMQKEIVIQRLREQGCRITKQRLMLLDVILNEDCSCCKEIYYRAAEVDPGIGAATVYRMVNLLEEIGAISRKNMYRIACGAVCDREKACNVSKLPAVSLLPAGMACSFRENSATPAYIAYIIYE